MTVYTFVVEVEAGEEMYMEVFSSYDKAEAFGEAYLRDNFDIPDEADLDDFYSIAAWLEDGIGAYIRIIASILDPVYKEDQE